MEKSAEKSLEVLKSLKLCPRCGGEYTYIEHDKRGYYYAVHERREGKKKIRRKCYLGPEVYKYVSKLHEKEGLMFLGAHDPFRLIEYLETIAQHLESYSPANIIIDTENPILLDYVEKLVATTERLLRSTQSLRELVLKLKTKEEKKEGIF